MEEHPNVAIVKRACVAARKGDRSLASELFADDAELFVPLQLTHSHKVATPANWNNGDDVIILPSLSDDQARERFPDGWVAPRPYIRVVPQPGR